MNGIGIDENDADPAATPGIAVLSNKYRAEFDGTDVTLTALFQTVFTYSGSGKFVGFTLTFDGSTPRVRLTIDSTEVIFNELLCDIRDAGLNLNSNKITGTGLVVDSDQLLFRPLSPIPYESEVLVEVQDSTGKKLLSTIVGLTKET